MKNLKMSAEKTLTNDDLNTIKGGLPKGWTKTTLPDGSIRYDGPNGSWMIVHAK